jgi:hypothetical protein
MKPLIVVLAAVCAAANGLWPSGATGMDPTIAPPDWLGEALKQVSSERMVADITELSGPSFLGRQTGSPQDAASAAFVADRFSALRLHPPPAPPAKDQTAPLPFREWQQATRVSVITVSDPAVLQVGSSRDQTSLRIGEDFLPILDSPPADIPQTPVVFVGYGLADPSRGYDDYAGLDVKDRIVLFLRGKPDHYAGPAAHPDKERVAKEKGARAYLTATGPVLSAYEARRGVTGKPTAFYSGTPDPSRLPGAWISTEQAEALVARGAGRPSLRVLQEEIAKTGTPRSKATDATASMRWDSRSADGTLYNVVSAIRGSSARAEEAVIIGAHRDHFGRQAGLLFPGADDNASGTAVLLEVARVLAQAPAAPKRSVLFVSFSGEEQGLLGSRLYVSQPVVPLAKTVAMINVDHAGIGNGRLTVGVTGMEKTVAAEAGQLVGLADKLDLFGFFPGGDHVPFKEAGVPTVTVVSGGVHPHFHQPTDTADTVDPEILRSIARYVLALTWQLANAP